MFGDLGLAPGSSVTGAPHVLGADAHRRRRRDRRRRPNLTTAYNDAEGRPTEGSAGTDLAGQTFTAGVRTASSSLLLSSGSVILDAQGNPNAVFIFQIGSTLITGSNTTVQLINGAQACNVFWQVGSSATLGTGTRFVGTVMAQRNDHGEHGRDYSRPSARADRRCEPRHEHDHAGQLRDRCHRNRNTGRNGCSGSNDDWRRHDDRWYDGYDTNRHVTDARERRSGRHARGDCSAGIEIDGQRQAQGRPPGSRPARSPSRGKAPGS